MYFEEKSSILKVLTFRNTHSHVCFSIYKNSQTYEVYVSNPSFQHNWSV